MVVDKFGLPFLYPTKTGGWFYEQSPDITKDQEFFVDSVSNSGGNSWTLTTSGPTSPDIAKNFSIFSDNAIGGCSMDFAKTAERGYAYKADDPRDIEFKMIISFEDDGDGSGFSISCTSGSHSGSGCCSGFSYMITNEYTQNPTTFRFRKEMWHVSYHDDPKTGIWTHPDFNFKFLGHGNIGLAFVRYNKKDGVSTGKDSVIIECWGCADPDNDPTNWVMMKRTEDKGGWGNDGDKCGGNKDQIGTWAPAKFRIKSNNSHGVFVIKDLSVREIDPFKAPDDNPDEPPPGEEPGSTTTVKGSFKLQWDLNTYRTSQCSGTGSVDFYSVAVTDEKELSNSTTFQNRTRVCEKVNSSFSPIFNKTPKSVVVPMKKVGTPSATPAVHCKIWNSSGVVFDCPTTIDPTTLTTSYVDQTFDFSTNTHVMVTGDYIGVEWTGTSSTNYIKVGYDPADPVLNSVYANYESGVWEHISTRDFACTMLG